MTRLADMWRRLTSRQRRLMDADPAPWPTGTRLVCTWRVPCQAPSTIGMVVIALEATARLKSSDQLCQLVTDGGEIGYHPIRWMRPIEDPDGPAEEEPRREPKPETEDEPC